MWFEPTCTARSAVKRAETSEAMPGSVVGTNRWFSPMTAPPGSDSPVTAKPGAHENSLDPGESGGPRCRQSRIAVAEIGMTK